MAIGDFGVYRRPAGVNPSHKPKASYSFKDPQKQADFESFTGNLFYDHPSAVVSTNADGTVNVIIFGDPARDTWEVRSVRNVSVSSTVAVGAFTPQTPNADTSGEAQ